jgi:predicted RNA binding protein YcfA (HicA-like mRNA interferase family)
LKLPRDLSGYKLASLLRQYNYRITRQTGSHLRLTSNFAEAEHHVTIPAHDALKVGTLSAILDDISKYLKIEKSRLAEHLFGG